MVRTEFLVANKQRTQQTDVSQLEDRDLLILLGGIKELAQIRGFTDVCILSIPLVKNISPQLALSSGYLITKQIIK